MAAPPTIRPIDLSVVRTQHEDLPDLGTFDLVTCFRGPRVQRSQSARRAASFDRTAIPPMKQ